MDRNRTDALGHVWAIGSTGREGIRYLEAKLQSGSPTQKGRAL